MSDNRAYVLRSVPKLLNLLQIQELFSTRDELHSESVWADCCGEVQSDRSCPTEKMLRAQVISQLDKISSSYMLLA